MSKIIYEITEEAIVRHNEDGSTTYIPSNLDNSDYQAYLESLENEA